MRIMVTGGAGFIASHIVDGLINIGHEIAIVDNLITGKTQYINDKAKRYMMDIADVQLEHAFQDFRPEIVIHHAAQISVQASINNPLFDAQTNISGTIALLELCKKHAVRKIIYASSAAVYGIPNYLPVDESHPIAPLSFYGISKHTPEQYIKLYSELFSLDYTILRYANVYGPRQDPAGEGGVVSIFIDYLTNDKSPFIYGDGEQTRDFIYVKDIVSANIAALTAGSKKTMNISTNSQISVNSLFTNIQQLIPQAPAPQYAPSRSGDIEHSVLDNSQAIQELNWTPLYTLEQGLHETCEFYKHLASMSI
ncbi:NAD-dependent epimerase/dehydratase family protein [Paenibacillus oenotherae]|uniref:NAD-dependent epimerase/dehydratase family protein n=1 Tax=Paenibacillus oenotherae TaxID=1435645 RepID=A0ABS7D596_9BACL|nr:NAD-dependent epimerase/dehydratase family protein [Paenibacillus oenotherae]MBW7475065.1 NAD-dependent epimerase/dehydratase family protein [Paenibacillus oenotherae]